MKLKLKPYQNCPQQKTDNTIVEQVRAYSQFPQHNLNTVEWSFHLFFPLNNLPKVLSLLVFSLHSNNKEKQKKKKKKLWQTHNTDIKCMASGWQK